MNNRTRLLAAALAAAPALAAHAQPLTFTTETVIADGMFNNRPATRIDDNGVTRLAFAAQSGTNSATAEVFYANNANDAWTITQITNNAVREEFPDLTLDNQGNVHIAFHTGTGTTNKVRYTNNTSGAFFPPTDITLAGYVIVEHEIDSSGTAHFVYRSQTFTGPEDIFYRTFDPATGTGPQTNLTKTAFEESSPQLAVAPDDSIHIVYHQGDAFGGPLVYLNNTSGSFQTVTTPVTADVTDPIILIDNAGVVSIFYDANNQIFLTDNASGTFAPPIQVFSQSAIPSQYERFAVDDQGRRYLAFSSNGNDLQGVAFIRETDDGFEQPQIIDNGSLTNLATSIDINAQGTIAINYALSGFNSSTSTIFADLFFATTDIAPPCPGDTDADDSVGLDDLLTVLTNFGATTPNGPADGDLDNSGTVDLDDLLAVLAGFGTSCP
jgi:hypothetical protein